MRFKYENSTTSTATTTSIISMYIKHGYMRAYYALYVP